MVSQIYLSLSITLLIFLTIPFLTTPKDGLFKEAQAHSTTVPVRGAGPFGIAYNSANNNMYVANYHSSTVSVISGSSDSAIASILAGRGPISIAYAPASNKLYVVNALSNDVTVINGATNKVIKNIPVGTYPVGIAYNPSNNDAYVVNLANNTITVIDTAIDSVISTIPLENVPPPPSSNTHLFLTYDSTNAGMYVGGGAQVSVVNSATNADVKDVRIPPHSTILSFMDSFIVLLTIAFMQRHSILIWLSD